MNRALYLTKSSFVRGMVCHRMLWLDQNQPLPHAGPTTGSSATGLSAPGLLATVGTEVGVKAHHLFPGGQLVDEAPWRHREAMAQTVMLMTDGSVPAIFEAAFEADGVRIRADILERLPNGRWGLREVKSVARIKSKHIQDAAVQTHVLERSGFDVASIELIKINTAYVYRGGEIDWSRLLTRVDVGDGVRAELPAIAEAVAAQHSILTASDEPEIEPGPHCPADCAFWEHCTASKPADWIFRLPRLSSKAWVALREAGIERIRDIPDGFELSNLQARVRDVVVSGRPYVSNGLVDALAGLNGAVCYLDFEAMNPAIPAYAGTRAFQRIAFQWSLHRDDGSGRLSHAEHLGDPASDPRVSFARSLVAALDGTSEPIVVYSSYERSVLTELAALLPDLAPALMRISSRFVDLYTIVRNHVYCEGFNGSLSIKTVGKSLAPGFTYDGLEHVVDGASAASAFQRMAHGEVNDIETTVLRQALLTYCRLDTLAMVETHRGLIRLSKAA